MPKSKDVGKNIKALRKSKTKRGSKQILAIALSEARSAGNRKIKAPKKKK